METIRCENRDAVLRTLRDMHPTSTGISSIQQIAADRLYEQEIEHVLDQGGVVGIVKGIRVRVVEVEKEHFGPGYVLRFRLDPT